jgi:CBS domain containing-hemolysin-like protein
LSSLLLLAFLLALQAFLTGGYFALTNASRKHLKELQAQHPARVQRTLRLLERDEELTALHQFLTILCSMAAAVLLSQWLRDDLLGLLADAGLRGPWLETALWIFMLPLLSLLFLWLGFQIPVAAIAGRRSERIAVSATPLMSSLLTFSSPWLNAAQAFSQRIGQLLGGEGKHLVIMEEEIKTLVSEGSQDGSIEADEKQMIYSVLKFGDTLVRELMVPRTDIIALQMGASLNEALDLIIRAGHSRIPVYEDELDNVKGFLYAKDLLICLRENRAYYHLPDLLREPFFIPESKRADELLEELRLRKTHVAMVNDEYGSVSGLITLEDLLEQIVGDIRDEYDLHEEAEYERVEEGVYLVQAWMDLDDLNELLDISLPTADNDTIGGLVFSELGKLPEVGDKVTAQGYEIEVIKLKGERRIQQIRLTALKPAPEPSRPGTAPLIPPPELSEVPSETALSHDP